MSETNAPIGLALLRQPFPPHQISKLPKPTAKRDVMDQLPKAICKDCGQYHATSKVMHLDYVGHAALTDRLLDADPAWSWEPLAMSPDGLPVFDGFGGMWIKLTVCGVTRMGYGAAEGKDGPNAIKEVIGDALRNAAMRFGAALDLWHKGDLRGSDDDEDPKTGPAANDNKGSTQAKTDMSPKARAARILTGIAAGDALGAAMAMSEWPQAEIEAVWALLDAKAQDKLNAVWPKGDAA